MKPWIVKFLLSATAVAGLLFRVSQNGISTELLTWALGILALVPWYAELLGASGAFFRWLGPRAWAIPYILTFLYFSVISLLFVAGEVARNYHLVWAAVILLYLSNLLAAQVPTIFGPFSESWRMAILLAMNCAILWGSVRLTAVVCMKIFRSR